MPRKTLKQWTASGKEFNDFYKPFDEVDEAIIEHLNYYVPASFDNGVFIQIGECEQEINGVDYYTTFKRLGDKYYYLGIIPKFKKQK